MSSSRIAKNTKIAFIDRISMALNFTKKACLARRISVAFDWELKPNDKICNVKLHFILSHFQSPSKIQSISFYILFCTLPSVKRTYEAAKIVNTTAK